MYHNWVPPSKRIYKLESVKSNCIYGSTVWLVFVSIYGSRFFKCIISLFSKITPLSLLCTTEPLSSSYIVILAAEYNPVANNVLIDLAADFRLKKASDYLKWYKQKHKSIKNIKKSPKYVKGSLVIEVSSNINFKDSLQWGLLDPNNGLQDPTPVMDKIEFNEDPI